tara:strand:+ start:149 stop:418 length:270 start_codon:yes stop_codon:yes gene_type:complete
MLKRKIASIIVIAFWVIVLTLLTVLTGCEKQEFIDIPERSKPDVSMINTFCCDWDAVNFEPYVNGVCVTEAYFRNSSACDNELCIYPNY